MKPLCTLAILLLLFTGSFGSAATQAPPTPAQAGRPNPFLAKSTLPFQAPAFDTIIDSDYPPAIEEGMRRQLAEIQAIADNPQAPTFANTIEALERSGDVLTRVSKVFFNLVQANANDTLQKIRADEAPKLAAHQDAVFLNAALFARVKSLYDRRSTLGLDTQAMFLLERDYRSFVRAGAGLSDTDKLALRALNQEEATLTTSFADKLLAEVNASAVVVDNLADLDGLSEGDVAAAALAAKERGLTGKWVLTLQNTTQQPPLASLKNRALRQRILQASMTRGLHGGPNDTQAIVARLAQLRAQRAKLLGFPDFASFVLDDQMARTPADALKLLTGLVPGATAKAADEAARMQKIIDAEKGGFQLGAADWDFYAEKVRKAEYDLDQTEVQAYFDLERVLRDGVFLAATKLYGITFKERKDLPVYHPDVRVWEVFDADGKSLALYYGDYYSRASKSGGAWQDSFVDPCILTSTRPVVMNVTNFTKPAPGQPALLSFDDVTTIFHEFGHALHNMFINPRYPTLGSVPRDFVETPSQINEHWALDPVIFASYAKHYKTGQPMPQALVDKIKRTRTFNQGYATTEYLAAALLDMAWHTVRPGDPLQEVAAFESAALKRFQVDVPQVPPRYHTTYFSHIWNTGYAAGYYAYLWSEVIDDDAYYWFKEHGGMTRANGQRFRDLILSRAGTQDSAALYRAFRGRDPEIEPLLEERGLKAPVK
jgi:peptidyl-dipeptidase Dcp